MDDRLLPDYYLRLKTPDPGRLTPRWALPAEMKVDRGNLQFRWPQPGEEYREVDPDRRTLREKILMGFARLGKASDAEILSFARQWGILGICHHGRPSGHKIDDYPSPNLKIEVGCPPLEENGIIYEPLAKWRDYAEQVRAILTLAIACRDAKPTEIDYSKTVVATSEKPGNEEDWAMAMREWLEDNQGNNFFAIDKALGGRIALMIVINHWLRINDIRPLFWWDAQRSGISLQARAVGTNGLLSIIAVQMMLEANNTVDLAICDGCRTPFLLRRGQSLQRKSYCLDCKIKGVPQREAVKTYMREERKQPSRKKRIRLTDKQVQTIQKLLKKNKPGLVEDLAEKYGVTKWAIYKIKERN